MGHLQVLDTFQEVVLEAAATIECMEEVINHMKDYMSIPNYFIKLKKFYWNKKIFMEVGMEVDIQEVMDSHQLTVLPLLVMVHPVIIHVL
jgi:hypothetical protein